MMPFSFGFFMRYFPSPDRLNLFRRFLNSVHWPGHQAGENSLQNQLNPCPQPVKLIKAQFYADLPWQICR